MNFLNSGLWMVLAPLVAVPLVIHLLNRQFPQVFRFPTIEHIRATLARRSQLQRWRHIVLLALRTAFLLALLFAFLKPVLPRFGSDLTGAGARHVVIVLDHSLSMEHRGGGLTARERAVNEAAKLIDSLGAEDAVNVVLLEQNPQAAFREFTQQHGDARRFLAALGPGQTRGDLGPTTTLVARLLAAAPSRPEVYFLSDFQRKNWAAADFSGLPAGTRVFFVETAPRQRPNRAVLGVRPTTSPILAGDTVPIEVTVGNFSDETFEGRVTVSLDRRPAIDAEASVAAWSVGKVLVPVPAGAPGLHLLEAALPPDALDADDRFRLTLNVADKEEVLIVSDAPADARSPAHFLSAALNPYEDRRGSLLPRVIRSTELTASRAAGVQKILLTRVDPLGKETAGVIAQSLFAGAGVLCFLDGAADAGNLASLEAAMGTPLPMRLAARRSATNITAGLQQFARGDFKSRYLHLFRGATRQDLGLLEFYDYWQAGATGTEGVLLAFGDGSPALAAASHGLGTLLLLNFSVAESSSNLARQRIFPAWIQELVKSVGASEPAPASHVLGEPLVAEIWKQDLQDTEFLDPAGKPVPVRREIKGDRYAVTLVPRSLGFHTLGAPKPRVAFAVNPSPDESDMRAVDRELLPTTTGQDKTSHFVSGRSDFDELAAGRPMYHWFVLGAVAFLVLEGGFQWALRRKTA